MILLAGAYASVFGADTSVLGRWNTGRISSIQYRDAFTGVARPTNGNHFSYEFQADGSYTFTGLMQSTIYNCTTSMFSEEKGRYRIEGGVLSLEPESNPYQMRNSCAPSSNKQAPGKLVPRRYRVKIEGQNLELTAEKDGGVSLLRRATE